MNNNGTNSNGSQHKRTNKSGNKGKRDKPRRNRRNRQNLKTKPCKFHQQGKCRHGEKCKYSHDTPSAAAGAAAAAVDRVVDVQQPSLVTGVLGGPHHHHQPQLQQPQQVLLSVAASVFQPNAMATPVTASSTVCNNHMNGRNMMVTDDMGEFDRYSDRYTQQSKRQQPPQPKQQFAMPVGDVRRTDMSSKQQRHQSRRARTVLKPRDLDMEEALFPREDHSGIQFDRYESIPVEASANSLAPPVDAFADMDLPEGLRLNLTLAQFSKPTPVQKYAVPVAMVGQDIMACAQTGSGKTGAFLFPFLARILNGTLPYNNPTSRSSRGYRRVVRPQGLILSPTRELATQIFDEAMKFTYRCDVRPVVVYGGQEMRVQLRELEHGCDIIVATPGRLVDFIKRGYVSLSNITYLVFDEADRMLDMGFEPQIREIVDGFDMNHDRRQTLMFSATFPKEIQRLAQDFLREYVFITVGRVGSSSDLITQRVEFVDEHEKKDRLMHLLPQCEGLTLIFVERKRSADALEDWLIRAGVNALSIHGDRSQDEREYALAMFRCGRCPVLVATDVAARGLDIPNVMDVVNYDMPHSIDDYVHRIGRTGRCGNTGNALSFINHRNSGVLKDLHNILTENSQVVPAWFRDMVHMSGRPSHSSSSSSSSRKSRKGKFASKDVRGDMSKRSSKRGNDNGGSKNSSNNDSWDDAGFMWGSSRPGGGSGGHDAW